MEDEIEDIVEDEEKAEKLSQLIEQKIEEKVEQVSSRETEQREKNTKEEKEEVSRRGFLKKLGAGALGLGAASMLPSVSAYDIKSSDGLEVWSGSNQLIDASSAPVEIMNSNLRLATGRSIEDGNGNSLFNIRDGYGYMLHGQSDETSRALLHDKTMGNTALSYTTSTSAPGTLELTNADLNVGSNKIKTSNFEVVENSDTNSLDFNYTG
ncbi:twin-arginine translocation signal domain-containing protein [Candidatus Nanohalobium constans]|uniref:Twin-arginine translocation signal domain-containing protein n=1 Tax=Candidatus Nanohalobium constans TaxID=2565781 RepID=A0A5Q0UFD5_9ARCH|nr:twin-arginine translocation signal domain-containing protein [Candidatus Nanohalobium constans]QGA80323.1 hypothetical protein LC1Nh_0422 [Candidatus Nanohalobium constans]